MKLGQSIDSVPRRLFVLLTFFFVCLLSLSFFLSVCVCVCLFAFCDRLREIFSFVCICQSILYIRGVLNKERRAKKNSLFKFKRIVSYKRIHTLLLPSFLYPFFFYPIGSIPWFLPSFFLLLLFVVTYTIDDFVSHSAFFGAKTFLKGLKLSFFLSFCWYL